MCPVKCTGANNGVRRIRNGKLNMENIFTGVKIGTVQFQRYHKNYAPTKREEKVKHKRHYWFDFVPF